MGITNGIATIPGFVTPSVVGAFTEGEVRNKNILCRMGGSRILTWWQQPGHRATDKCVLTLHYE